MNKKTMLMLDKNNYKLAEILDELNIKKLNLINCGNSIASGYSMSSFTKPLLLRNENIETILKNKGIELKKYNFSRPEDNNDERIFSWLINDIPLKEISKLNRFDISIMDMKGINKKNIDEYYPLDSDVTIKSLINSDKNIIVYNGTTGSFLDNITRNGNHNLFYGIKKDCTSLESFLQYIQELNREKKKDIQVYLCATPKLFGASDLFINSRLKKISEKYANVTYVPNVKKKNFYKIKNGKTIFDVHYDENEYLNLNNKIIETINDNYVLKKVFIEIDRKLYLLNKRYQMGLYNRSMLKDECVKIVFNTFYEYAEFIGMKNIERAAALKKLKKYLLERATCDYYYIGKNNIKTLVK